MQCPTCQTQVPEPAKFCLECGAPLPRTCPDCGASCPPRAKFCGECGSALQAVGPGTSPAAATAPAAPPATAPMSPGPLLTPTPPAAAEAESVAAGLAIADGERRPMTVLFCDMVGSTSLSTAVDPEDFSEVVGAYIEAAAKVIERYDGHVANYLGDGVLAYFGYPRAHEDDARRACQAGLDIVAGVPGLNARLRRDYDLEVAVRVGIHTGPTVIGAVGSDQSQDVMAVGETLNVAARLHDAAEPDSVVISDITRRLVQGYFHLDDLGPRAFKGFAEPLAVYRVLRPTGVTDRVAVADASELSPLVGRDAELAVLHGRWLESRAGHGRIVLVTAEAGLGKTRLVRALHERIADEPHLWLECRGSTYHVDSALWPLVDMAPQMWGFVEADEPGTRAARLHRRLTELGMAGGDALPLLAALYDLPLPPGSPAPPLVSPQVQRQRTMEHLAMALERMGSQSPVILVIEDLQWIDQSTLEFLHLLTERIYSLPLCLVLMGRRGSEVHWTVDAQVVLSPLPPDAVEKLILGVAGGKPLPAALLREIVQKSDGNPLYAEELTKMTLESGGLVEQDGGFVSGEGAQGLSIPASLQESLMARLDRIAPAKLVIQLGAVVGRHFPYSLVGEVLRIDDAKLQNELSQLVESGILFRRGQPPRATYSFKHALLQDAAYASMTRKTRRQFHSAIADFLIRQESDTAPEVLAQHLGEAQRIDEGAAAWQRAGQAALGSFALVEAMNHVRRGLQLIEGRQTTPERLATELGLRVTLGVPLMLTQGFASAQVSEHYAQLMALCGQLGDEATEQLFPALFGSWTYYEVSAQYAQAQETGERLLALAERVGDSGIALGAHVAYGAARLMRGDLAAARAQFEAGLQVYDMAAHAPLALLFGQDGGAMCAAFLTWVHAHDGDRAAGEARLQQALGLSESLRQPGTWGFVEAVAASYRNLLGEHAAGLGHAERVIELAREQGMPHWMAQGQINLGWSQSGLGEPAAGEALIRQGLAAFQQTGTRAALGYFQGALVDAELRRGHLDAATQSLALAWDFVAESDEQLHAPELFRLQGLLALETGDRPAAGAAFERGLTLAREQGAAAWEDRLSAAAALVAAGSGG